MGFFGNRNKPSDNDSYDYDDENQTRDVFDEPQPSKESTKPLFEARRVNCCTRLWRETYARQAWFPIRDPVNERLLDVPASFNAKSLLGKVVRVCLAFFIFFTMGWGLTFTADPLYFYMFFTNWGSFFASLYGLLAIYGIKYPFEQTDKATLRLRLVWGLYALALHTTGIAGLLYWLLVYNNERVPDFKTISPHGPTFLCLLIDGFLVSRIPLRFTHWMTVIMPVDVLYMVWTVVHAILEIGNPNQTDRESENDDLLYQVLDWKDDWLTAVIWSVVNVYVAGFLLYLVLWLASVVLPRRYVDERPTVDEVQEGSIFAEWR